MPRKTQPAERASSVRAATLLQQLVTLSPDDRSAQGLRASIEHELMLLLQQRGIAAVDVLALTLNKRGLPFTCAVNTSALRVWNAELPDARTLTIQTTSSRAVKSTFVAYRAEPAVSEKAMLTAAHALQKKFYDGYNDIAARAYASPAGRLNDAEKLILLIGELEADVNNGGFGQYTSNKGRKRAQLALTALRTVGAQRTADMLEAALSRGVSAAALAALDDEFFTVPEDLAVYTMKYLARQGKPGADS